MSIGEPKKRGRPVGTQDQKPRYRRTAEQISQDKLRIAQMKLDALRESEERKLAVKKTRPKKAPTLSETTLQSPPRPKTARRYVQREESPSPRTTRTARQCLYDSWFPSSPRKSHY